MDFPSIYLRPRTAAGGGGGGGLPYGCTAWPASCKTIHTPLIHLKNVGNGQEPMAGHSESFSRKSEVILMLTRPDKLGVSPLEEQREGWSAGRWRRRTSGERDLRSQWRPVLGSCPALGQRGPFGLRGVIRWSKCFQENPSLWSIVTFFRKVFFREHI